MTKATKTNNDNILILYTLILTVNKTAMKCKQTLLKSNLEAVSNVLILHKIKNSKIDYFLFKYMLAVCFGW